MRLTRVLLTIGCDATAFDVAGAASLFGLELVDLELSGLQDDASNQSPLQAVGVDLLYQTRLCNPKICQAFP